MTRFDSFAVVDWSSGKDTGTRPRKDAIWAGAVLGGTEKEPVYLRNREIAETWISDLIDAEARAGRRLLIGFDFPFGYPSGFAAAVTGKPDPLALWDYFAVHLTDTPDGNNRFALAGALNRKFPGIGPFWFNGTKTDIPDLPRRGSQRTPEHGMAERRMVEVRAKGSFTCWQMGGAGAVGGQVMTGMACLSRLRRKHAGQVSVWPFEPLTTQAAFVEIWPSLIREAVQATGDPIKDRAQVRLLTRALADLQPGRLAEMLDVTAPEEGWILGVGHEESLSEVLCPV